MYANIDRLFEWSGTSRNYAGIGKRRDKRRSPSPVLPTLNLGSRPKTNEWDLVELEGMLESATREGSVVRMDDSHGHEEEATGVVYPVLTYSSVVENELERVVNGNDESVEKTTEMAENSPEMEVDEAVPEREVTKEDQRSLPIERIEQDAIPKPPNIDTKQTMDMDIINPNKSRLIITPEDGPISTPSPQSPAASTTSHPETPILPFLTPSPKETTPPPERHHSPSLSNPSDETAQVDLFSTVQEKNQPDTPEQSQIVSVLAIEQPGEGPFRKDEEDIAPNTNPTLPAHETQIPLDELVESRDINPSNPIKERSDALSDNNDGINKDVLDITMQANDESFLEPGSLQEAVGEPMELDQLNEVRNDATLIVPADEKDANVTSKVERIVEVESIDEQQEIASIEVEDITMEQESVDGVVRLENIAELNLSRHTLEDEGNTRHGIGNVDEKESIVQQSDSIVELDVGEAMIPDRVSSACPQVPETAEQTTIIEPTIHGSPETATIIDGTSQKEPQDPLLNTSETIKINPMENESNPPPQTLDKSKSQSRIVPSEPTSSSASSTLSEIPSRVHSPTPPSDGPSASPSHTTSRSLSSIKTRQPSPPLKFPAVVIRIPTPSTESETPVSTDITLNSVSPEEPPSPRKIKVKFRELESPEDTPPPPPKRKKTSVKAKGKTPEATNVVERIDTAMSSTGNDSATETGTVLLDCILVRNDFHNVFSLAFEI